MNNLVPGHMTCGSVMWYGCTSLLMGECWVYGRGDSVTWYSGAVGEGVAVTGRHLGVFLLIFYGEFVFILVKISPITGFTFSSNVFFQAWSWDSFPQTCPENY